MKYVHHNWNFPLQFEKEKKLLYLGVLHFRVILLSLVVYGDNLIWKMTKANKKNMYTKN